jgi:hypothetical protein
MVDILKVSKQQHRKNGVDNDDSLYYRTIWDTDDSFMLGHI